MTDHDVRRRRDDGVPFCAVCGVDLDDPESAASDCAGPFDVVAVCPTCGNVHPIGPHKLDEAN